MKTVEYETMLKAERDHWWFKSRRDIIDHLFWKPGRKLPAEPSILSVGVSTGAELEYLSCHGCVTGLDICHQNVEFSRGCGFDVLEQDMVCCAEEDAKYDIVFAMDVLEHIEDHEKAFEQIVRVLKPGGHIVITVPAFMFLWSGHDVEFEHVRRYTKKSLKRLISTQPVAIEKLSYYNFFLFPLALAVRKLGLSSTTQLTLPSSKINSLMHSIFSSEKRFLKWMNFPFGVSLISIVRKK